MYSDAALINLSGGESELSFIHSHNFYHVQNLGDSSVKISVLPDISGRDDGVIEIPAGGSATLSSGKENKLYIYGSGKINLAATDSNVNPFRNAAKGGGGGGTGVSSYPALTDLPSINGVTLLGNKTSEELGLSGGGSTNDYDKLDNRPKVNGKLLTGNVTQEELGWYELTEDDAVDIVDEAFDEIYPQYKTVAEYSLAENFDGYGLTFSNKGVTTDTSFSDGKWLSSTSSYFSFSVDDYDPSKNDTIIISFDMSLSTTSLASVNFFETNIYNGYYWGLQPGYTGYVYVYSLFRRLPNSSGSVRTDTPMGDVDVWTNISLRFSNYQRHLDVSFDGGEYINCNDLGISDMTTDIIANNIFTFNPNKVKNPFYYKNLKVEISK